MKRVRMVTYLGKNIVLVDLSNAKSEEILPTLEEAKAVISKQGLKSARILTDVSNAAYTREVSESIKNFSTANTPYVRASAVTGLDGLRAVLLQAVMVLTRREIKVFSGEKPALEFLAGN